MDLTEIIEGCEYATCLDELTHEDRGRVLREAIPKMLEDSWMDVIEEPDKLLKLAGNWHEADEFWAAYPTSDTYRDKRRELDRKVAQMFVVGCLVAVERELDEALARQPLPHTPVYGDGTYGKAI